MTIDLTYLRWTVYVNFKTTGLPLLVLSSSKRVYPGTVPNTKTNPHDGPGVSVGESVNEECRRDSWFGSSIIIGVKSLLLCF